MATNLTSSFEISVSGKPLPYETLDLVRRGTVERSWSAADRAVIEFRAEEFELPGEVGDDLKIHLVRDGESTEEPLFDGVITGVGLRVGGDGQARLSVEGLDRRHLLTRKIEPKTYKQFTFGDVVQQIASEHGLRAGDTSDLGSTKFEYFIVADSHFAVLQQIARRTGTVWTLDGTTINFADPGTKGRSVPADLGTELIDIDLRFVPVEQPGKVTVNGWDQAKGKAFAGQHTPKVVQSTNISAKAKATATALSWNGGAVSVDDANGMAAGMGRRMRASELTGWGVLRATEQLRPGGVVEITGIGDQFGGKYTVSDVTHRFGDLDGSATTEFRIGSPESTLDQLLGGDERIGGKAPHGITVGVVTETDDADGNARPGSVRVKLPMISDELETGWIRMASIGSGPDRGIVFVPEVNDEVVVAFEHGELNRPYVLGTLWNEAGGVFDDTNERNVTDERRIVSKLGHRIRFIDGDKRDGTSGVVIDMDDEKTRVFLGYEEVTIETQDRPLTIRNGKASILLDNNDVTIEGNNITIEAKQEVQISSGSDTSVKGANISLDAQVQLTAEARTMAKIDGGPMTEVKGGMVKVN